MGEHYFLTGRGFKFKCKLNHTKWTVLLICFQNALIHCCLNQNMPKACPYAMMQTFICAFRINRFLKIGFSLFLEAEGGFFWGYGQFHLAALDERGVP